MVCLVSVRRSGTHSSTQTSNVAVTPDQLWLQADQDLWTCTQKYLLINNSAKSPILAGLSLGQFRERSQRTKGRGEPKDLMQEVNGGRDSAEKVRKNTRN